MLLQVFDIERPEGVGFFRCIGIDQILDALSEAQDVLLCFIEMSRRGLGRGNRLEKSPEEADVEAFPSQAERAVVKSLVVKASSSSMLDTRRL